MRELEFSRDIGDYEVTFTITDYEPPAPGDYYTPGEAAYVHLGADVHVMPDDGEAHTAPLDWAVQLLARQRSITPRAAESILQDWAADAYSTFIETNAPEGDCWY